LQPLEEADKTFKLNAEQIHLKQFLAMIEHAEPRDHLDKAARVAYQLDNQNKQKNMK